jgi:hypothetical protein
MVSLAGWALSVHPASLPVTPEQEYSTKIRNREEIPMSNVNIANLVYDIDIDCEVLDAIAGGWSFVAGYAKQRA